MSDTKLTVRCTDDPDDVLEFETDTERRELTVDISLLSDDFPSVVICIDKQRAEQIVNHLIKVFDITPLHD